MPFQTPSGQTRAPKKRKQANISFAHAQAISTALGNRDYGPRSGGSIKAKPAPKRQVRGYTPGGKPRATGKPRRSGWDFNVLAKMGGAALQAGWEGAGPLLRLLGGGTPGKERTWGDLGRDIKGSAAAISGVHKPSDIPLAALASLLPVRGGMMTKLGYLRRADIGETFLDESGRLRKAAGGLTENWNLHPREVSDAFHPAPADLPDIPMSLRPEILRRLGQTPESRRAFQYRISEQLRNTRDPNFPIRASVEFLPGNPGVPPYVNTLFQEEAFRGGMDATRALAQLMRPIAHGSSEWPSGLIINDKLRRLRDVARARGIDFDEFLARFLRE